MIIKNVNADNDGRLKADKPLIDLRKRRLGMKAITKNANLSL